jgi:CheY-like chemotaxis protein/predicted  nucleic acid-binding Zn-ribbon protein
MSMSTKVLVFESDAAFAGELRSELGKLGCEIHVVDDGNVGLQHAAAERPDLILLSIELPRMNGFSVCNKLKKDAKLKDVPLIIMSSESSDETFEQHKKLRTRAEDYVHKPIAFGELLDHIQPLVPIGEPANGAGDDMIVVDDEVAIVDSSDLQSLPGDYQEDDATQIGRAPEMDNAPTAIQRLPSRPPQRASQSPRPPSQAPAPMPRASRADVDIEDAFGRITGESAAPPPVEDMDTAHNAVLLNEQAGDPPEHETHVEAPVVAKAPSARPPAHRSSPPLELADTQIHVPMTGAADALAAQTKISGLESEVATSHREIEELKSRLATASSATSIAPKPAGGGVSSREFLDLRENLNKKDKEILALKESFGRKEKEILDAREKNLVLERAKGEFADKVLAAERELADARDKNDALAADKEQAKKASEDFKTRMTRAVTESEARTKEAVELRARLNEMTSSHETLVTSMRTESETTIAQLREEHQTTTAQALDETRADAEAQMTSLQAQHDQALVDLQRSKDDAIHTAAENSIRERAKALLEHEKEMREEYTSDLTSRQREHAEEIARARAEAARELEAINAKHAADLTTAESRRERELGELRQEAAEDIAVRTTELNEARASAVAALERDHAAQVAEIEQERDARLIDLARDRDAKIAAAEADKANQISVIEQDRDDRIAKLERDRDQRIQSIERARDERISSLERDRDDRVAALEADRDDRLSTLSQERDRQLVDAQSRADAQLAALGAEQGDKIAAVENERDARIASAEAKARREIDEANGEKERAASELQNSREQLSAITQAKRDSDSQNAARIADLEERLSSSTRDRDSFERELSGARDRAATLEADLSAARDELNSLRDKLAAESVRADRASAKWNADKGSLDRAKDALAIALAQIEETETRDVAK